MKDKLTQISDDLNHEVITEKEAREQLLILCGVVRSTRKHADSSLKFNCGMCKTYYENNLNAGKVVNRCCPTCASVLPSI